MEAVLFLPTHWRTIERHPGAFAANMNGFFSPAQAVQIERQLVRIKARLEDQASDAIDLKLRGHQNETIRTILDVSRADLGKIFDEVERELRHDVKEFGTD